MKNRFWVYTLISAVVVLFITNSCKKDDPKIIKEKVTGSVQKGPFINGTSISMFELNSSLQQTGNTFNTQILNNAGTFEIDNISLTSSLVEFSASGYYFDEIKGDKSISQLNLYALSDITDISTVNVNILTHLEKQRVEYLIKQSKTFSEAKKMAQAEILAMLGFSQSEMNNSETLDISVNNESNAILLAISIILQGNRSVGDLTELMANISNDIREDGVLNSESIKTSLRNSTKELVLTTIRTNLVNRYEELGVSATIPNFEKYINDFLAFTGQKPSATAQSATNITTTSATLNGIVNSNSLNTTIIFQYGTTLSYGDSVNASQSTATGSLPISVSGEITGLLPGTAYHFRVKTENTMGVIYSEDQSYNTLGLAPECTSTSATNIRYNLATINGLVNPNFLLTTVSFEWGTTTEYGNSVPAIQNPEVGDALVNVSAILNGLLPGTTYHFKVKAENELGVTYSNDLTFITNFDGQEGIVNDNDGNVYKTIGIGTQIWMGENLKTTKYSDNIDIPFVPNQGVWETLLTPGYCNDSANYDKVIYGALYNWYAVNTGKLCPTGWHVPSDSEWAMLIDYLGSEEIAEGKLRETGTTHWIYNNKEATNETGFTALPGGARTRSYESIDRYGYWWSSTEFDPYWAWHVLIDGNRVYITYNVRFIGLSVRCVKD